VQGKNAKSDVLAHLLSEAWLQHAHNPDSGRQGPHIELVDASADRENQAQDR
jgi:hypothetical protein